jgi:hypothetical protein
LDYTYFELALVYKKNSLFLKRHILLRVLRFLWPCGGKAVLGKKEAVAEEDFLPLP